MENNRTSRILFVQTSGMPSMLPKPDPAAFAERLNETLTARGIPVRGRGTKLAAMFQVKPPTVSGWLNGTYMPEADKVLAMSEEWKVPFEWLYFGRGALPSAIARLRGEPPPEAPASTAQQLARLQADITSLRTALVGLTRATNAHVSGVAPAFLSELQEAARDDYYADRGFHGVLVGLLEQLVESAEAAQPELPAAPARKAAGK
jgi:transcriptional regulator with XRE-family HTH domain